MSGVEFLLSIVSGIFSSIIVAIIVWVTSRIWLYGFYSDIAKVYNSKKSGRKAVNKDTLKSNTVKILSIRGKSIVESSEYPNLWNPNLTNKQIELIVSALDNDQVILDRSKANNIDVEEYKQQMKYAQDILDIKEQKYGNLTVYHHKENPAFKLIILDHCLYVSYYLRENNVNRSRLVKYKSENGAYNAFLQYYETVKKHAVIETRKIKQCQ